MVRMTVLWALLAGGLAAFLLARMEAVEALVATAGWSRSEFDGGTLYARLLQMGLLRKEGERLMLPPVDLELQEAAFASGEGRSYPPAGQAWKERHEVLKELYAHRNSQGDAVRRAIRNWNASRTFIAIRDDRHGMPPVETGPILEGERQNEWRAADHRNRPLYCNQLDVDPAGRQEAPREGADAAAVCAWLEAMGRAVDCQTTKMPGGLPCAGG